MAFSSIPPTYRVEPLGKSHHGESFCCGVDGLDRYLRTQASQDVSKHVAVCFVLTANGETIAGYYTLSQFSVDLVCLPGEIAKKLPKYPEVPATLLGRLAISQDFRGRGLGEFLLLDALNRSFRLSKKIAAAAVVVDAKDEKAQHFYERYDFIRLPGTPHRLFLPMATISQLFKD